MDLEMLPDKLPSCWQEFYKKLFVLAAKLEAMEAKEAEAKEKELEKE